MTDRFLTRNKGTGRDGVIAVSDVVENVIRREFPDAAAGMLSFAFEEYRPRYALCHICRGRVELNNHHSSLVVVKFTGGVVVGYTHRECGPSRVIDVEVT